MKRILLLIISITALVATLLMGSSAVMANKDKPGSQTWYLDGWAGNAVNSRQMVRTGTIHPDPPMIIYSGLDMVWVADQAAEVDNTFSDGSWVLALNTDKNWAATDAETPNINVQIGGYNPATGNFYYFNTIVGTNGYIRAAKLVLVSLVQTQTATILKGDYLAVRVYNNDPNVQHTVYFNDGASTLVSPVSDPGYACPEVASGILLGVGLVGLVSYVAIRRKKVTAS
jgi:hypothetical protein